jgi:hypothetical protein
MVLAAKRASQHEHGRSFSFSPASCDGSARNGTRHSMRKRTKGKVADRRAETRPPASTGNVVESQEHGTPLEPIQQRILEDVVAVFELLLRWDQQRRRH